MPELPETIAEPYRPDPPAHDSFAALYPLIRRHLKEFEYDAILLLMTDPDSTDCKRKRACEVVQTVVPHWERILLYRQEGAIERRRRRLGRQAREIACDATEVQLLNATLPNNKVAVDHFDDGSGDYVAMDISTRDKMDGLLPLVVTKSHAGTPSVQGEWTGGYIVHQQLFSGGGEADRTVRHPRFADMGHKRGRG